MKKTVHVLIAAVIAVVLAGCKTESTHTSEATLTTTVNGETTEYNLSADASVKSDADEQTQTEDNAAQAEDGNVQTEEDDDISEEVYDAAGYVDDYIAQVWSEEGCNRHVTVDPDHIYAQVWCEGITYPDQLDKQAFDDEVIPQWQDFSADVRKELDSRGLDNVGFTLQYITDSEDEEIVFLTLENGEVIYCVLDDEQ